MTEWKILISDSLEEGGKALLADQAEVHDRPGLSAAELLEIIGGYHALVVRGRTKVTKEVLEAGEKLRIVGRAGVGVDNIDLAAAAAKGVTVVNSPIATTNAVAEHSLALMLALIRQVARADAAMKSGQWPKQDLLGAELSGKTLGLLGLGRIGSRVAELAAAFGMRVLAYDPLLTPEDIRGRGAEPAELEQVYARSDIISLHLPLTPETRGLVDGEALSRMRRGVYLISAARGGIVDETALLARLESGQVAGAALDVFSAEPPGLTALVAHPRVIATPHIAAQTAEAQERAAVDIATEIISGLKDEPLRWRVV
ncbi:MAG: hydroxyacid dehydrogenase [Chloroflexi bacterium]|nr:hydroxyacid dehydrogenase [Chloroflexota bacterium]